MYADDLIIISGYVKKLQRILHKCNMFGLKMDIAFNIKNSFCFCTYCNKKIYLRLNGVELPFAAQSFNNIRVELGVK